jgi:hypothetical protein
VGTMSGDTPEGSYALNRDHSYAPPPHHRLSRSPVPRRPRNRSSGRAIIVEWVIEKSIMGITYPVLTCTNYCECSLVMRVNLQAGLWDAIKDGTTDYCEDQNALAALFWAVPEEMQAGLARKESTTDAWEAIRVMHMGGERIKEANADKLHRDFSDLQFKLGECIEDFSLCMTALTNQLRELGDKVTEKEEIKKLHSVPDHLEQVAISNKILLNLNKMMIQEATSHPRVVEERKKKHTSGSKEGHLLLTEEEWMAYLKVCDRESSGGGGRGGRGHSRGRRGGHGGTGGGRESKSNSHEESAL